MGIDFDRSVDGIGLTSMMCSEAPDIEAPQVKARFSLDDPFGHHFAYSSCSRNPMGAEACGNEEVLHLWGFSHDKIPIRSEGLRAVEEGDNFSVANGRDSLHCENRERLQMFIVGFCTCFC